MTDSVVTVTLDGAPYATRIEAGRHTVVADEPGTLGGKDTGPGPYDLLLASLGSCKVITARMYADRKGWNLRSVRAQLAHSRPEGRNGPELITVAMAFGGDLTDDQRSRLLEIAEKCPVQKTISGGLRVEATLSA
jgi:putative redox protein